MLALRVKVDNGPGLTFISSLETHSRNKSVHTMGSLRNPWANNKTEPLWIASPLEDERIRRSKQCTREGVIAGTKAAVVAAVATAIPTLAAVRMVPWAKANLNYTAQALIISAGSIAAYFITADKTILECARRNAQYRE